MPYVEEHDKIWVQEPFAPEGRWIDLRGCIIVTCEIKYADELRGVRHQGFLPEDAAERMPDGWLDWALREDEVGFAIGIELEFDDFGVKAE